MTGLYYTALVTLLVWAVLALGILVWERRRDERLFAAFSPDPPDPQWFVIDWPPQPPGAWYDDIKPIEVGEARLAYRQEKP